MAIVTDYLCSMCNRRFKGLLYAKEEPECPYCPKEIAAMKLHVLYHDNCPDGFGAAFAVWLKKGADAEYVPCRYGEPFPASVPDGCPILMVDFSYPRDEMNRIHRAHPDITVLDHHKTAMEALHGRDYALFDMNHSGATLAWAYCHSFLPATPGNWRARVMEQAREAPMFFRYIEDRDLWRFDLPDSREFSAALFSYPRTFEAWKPLYFDCERDPDIIVEQGVHILRARKQMVEEICAGAFMTEIGGHLVPVANTSVMFSEVPNRLLELYPDAPFAASYRDMPGEAQIWSLRSCDQPGRIDVSEVAKKLGGGGHRNSAGFRGTHRG